jgi:CDP-diacylglycerol---glycerol-3-phosphate 3-phosphatidyltransferase
VNLFSKVTDQCSLLALFALVLLASGAYLVRVLSRGRAQFERVDRQGGSIFLAKSVMEMGYWSVGPLARGLMAIGFTANRVTWLSLFLGGGAGVCLGQGRFGLGTWLATSAAVFDMLDGMIARETGTASRAGKVLDSSLDRYVEFFFLAGVAYYFRGNAWLVLLAMAAMHGSFMVSYTTALSEIQGVDVSRGSMRRPERMVLTIVAAALMPFSEWFMVVALALIAVFANISALLRMREMMARLEVKEEVPHSVLKQTGSSFP